MCIFVIQRSYINGSKRYGNQGFKRGCHQAADFEMAQVSVREVDNSDNKTTSVTYFDGRMLVFDFPDKIVSSVLIYSNKFKNRALLWML